MFFSSPISPNLESLTVGGRQKWSPPFSLEISTALPQSFKVPQTKEKTMKLLSLGIALSLLSITTFASIQESPGERDTVLHTQQMRLCDWWIPIQTSSGSAYACSAYPFSFNVADARDIERALNNAERRIAALEAKIGTLEARLQQSE